MYYQSYLLELKLVARAWARRRIALSIVPVGIETLSRCPTSSWCLAINRTCWNWNKWYTCHFFTWWRYQSYLLELKPFLPGEGPSKVVAINRTCWNWNYITNHLTYSMGLLSIVPVGIETRLFRAWPWVLKTINRTCWNWNFSKMLFSAALKLYQSYLLELKRMDYTSNLLAWILSIVPVGIETTFLLYGWARSHFYQSYLLELKHCR